jgi:hypothetical protein
MNDKSKENVDEFIHSTNHHSHEFHIITSWRQPLPSFQLPEDKNFENPKFRFTNKNLDW